MNDTAPPRPTRAEIDLQALRHNLARMRDCATPRQAMLAVVKADAYGHGARVVSRVLSAEGVEYLGVATLEEGLDLRAARIDTPILVFGGCYPGQEKAFVDAHLTPAVLSLDDLQRLGAFVDAQKMKLAVHLKFDTGMGRVGFLPSELAPLIAALKKNQRIIVEGVMSHLACADVPGSQTTEQQIGLFRHILAQLRQAQVNPQWVHLANSAGLAAWELPECNLARPGIALYGGAPLSEGNAPLGLQPVMRFVTRIAQLRALPTDSGISYGHTHQTQKPSRLAVLPVGYADGYNRLLSNRASVLVHGQRAPLVGRVCMDWIIVDVSVIEGVEVGDPVVLLGRDGEEEIPASEWARLLDTIDYEIFCRIDRRVPRYYVNA